MSRIVALLLAGLAASRATCNIPVFRYALERWQAAPYEVVVFHRGPVDDEGRAVLNALRQTGANIEVDRIDVAEPVPPKRKAVLDRLKLEAPRIVALYPGTDKVAWTGPLTKAAAAQLADSKARREVVKRLMAGESAVWVLLESGHAEADDAAARVLESELKRLTTALKLPAHKEEDPPLLLDLPLRVSFSILRIAAADAEEAPFRAMLKNWESGLDGPVVYPVFGRGRALEALAGKGINAEHLGDAGAFLIGACSCEAKEENPGFDLLFAADWEAGLAAASPREPVPVPVLKPRSPDPAPASSSPPESKAFLWGALLVAGLAVAVTGRRLLGTAKK